MTKKVVLLTVAFYSFGVATTIAAPDCVLSGSDLQALALSPSHLTAEQFAAAPAAQQKSVCKTRAAIRQLDADGGVMKDETTDITLAYSRTYLSPTEYDRIDRASDVLTEKTLKEKGYGN